MADKNRKKISVIKTTAPVADQQRNSTVTVTKLGSQNSKSSPLTEREVKARMIKKYSTTTFGFNTRSAASGGYSGSGDVSSSQYGNFYSPQLSTDFLEKPQNLRERRAWYRHFYNSNEFVGQAIDLHSTLPLSKIRLEKPKCVNEHMSEYVYDYYMDMCNDMKLFKALIEISHEYHIMGNVFVYAEDHDPYTSENEDINNELKSAAKLKSDKLLKEFGIFDKDPNYMGWKKLLILPPDQVRVKKVPMSDEVMVEFIPDPETRKVILHARDGIGPQVSFSDAGGITNRLMFCFLTFFMVI